jgi:hypothetical protein
LEAAADNMKRNAKDDKWIWKSDKELETARALQDAQRKTGISFGEIVAKAAKCHERISHRFGKETGLLLMKQDSTICRGVLYHFAEQGIPAIGVHDAIRVAETHEDELQHVMLDVYRKQLGFDGVIHKMGEAECGTLEWRAVA